ncbi:DUF3244 domain-containing protein [Carboxylicivirga taeanensis]|uniref:DUF3244 domain-containing protein n=1 Tax=Carboxylicivirga taeanensis TaxID=1416875 RepID=UPI003F6DEA07
MKKVNVIKQILPIAVLVLMSTGAFAKGKIFVSSYLKTDFAVITARIDAEDNYRVKLFNAQGDELYASSRIKGAESFQKLFDLTSLEDGEYTIELISKDNRAVETFTVENNALVKVNGVNDDVEGLNAFFRVANDRLYVSHMNFEQAALHISIDDKFGTEIYNSSLPSESTYSGMFDLKNLPSGEYQVLLTSGGKEYSYVFNR